MATTTRIGTFFGENPVISSSGRFVVFASPFIDSNGNRGGVNDVIIRNLETGEAFFLSTSSEGVLGNGSSAAFDAPAISANERFIVFTSDATNLVADDTNGVRDLFVKDFVNGTTTRVSLAADGSQVPANTFVSQYRPSVSGDGRFVAFQSRAQLAGEATFGDDIFVRDTVANTTEIVSVNSNGVQADSSSFGPSISADGRYVAFFTLASNLDARDTAIDRDYDIYVRDRLTQTTILASVNSQGQKGDGASSNASPNFSEATDPVMSSDGRFVVFESSFTNLVPNDTNNLQDVFMHDLQTGVTTRLSVDSDGNQANGNSGMGATRPSISADGRYVVFQSFANNLVPGDTNNALDVFVRDTVAGTTTRVSVNSNGEEAVGGFLGTESFGGTIAADGSKITFISNGVNLNDRRINTPEIYLRTLDVNNSGGGPEPLPNFDAAAYIASYQDLIDAFGYNLEAGRQHYLQYGLAEGRQVTFEADDYIASYGDLITAFGYNLAAGTQHYILYGAAEGRERDRFDETAYLNAYGDLQEAFGNDTMAATRHYIELGFFEGRIVPASGSAPLDDDLLTGGGSSDGLVGPIDCSQASLTVETATQFFNGIADLLEEIPTREEEIAIIEELTQAIDQGMLAATTPKIAEILEIAGCELVTGTNHGL